MSCGISIQPTCKVSPPKRNVERIRDPTPEPVVKRDVKRNPTPPGDVIERITVKRQPQQILEIVTEQPRKPLPKIICRVETEPAPPPIFKKTCVLVDPSPSKPSCPSRSDRPKSAIPKIDKPKSATPKIDRPKSATPNRDNKSFSNFDYKNQTKLLKNGNSARVNSALQGEKLLAFVREDGQTLYELFRLGEKLSNDGPYLGWKPSPNDPFKWISYSEANKIVEQVGSAFVQLGSSKGSFIGIYAKNRVEWVLAEQACNAYSLVSVPLYDTLGSEAISFILTQTELKIVVCDDNEKALNLMNSKSNLKYIIIVDDKKITDDVIQKANELNVKVLSFDKLKEMGASNLKQPVAPQPDDLATICYTSGTTGTPKGAMITHKNMVSVATSVILYFLDFGIVKFGEESYLSYLPLAHMFDRISQAAMVSIGAKIGFFQGDIKKLMDDVKELKPTLFTVVPRLLNRLYAKIKDSIEKSPADKKALFNMAYQAKEKEVMNGIVRNDGKFDLAFKQIREELGGQCKLILTGSAPIAPEILQFFRVVMGCHVLEGYGATETGGAASLQLPFETSTGNVGPPLFCSSVKLADVAEMNLLAERDNKGEILLGGNNIFKGYYKDEEKTKAALDSDGWYHTGDIGSFDTNGTIKIVDRVKHIFKLSQGEYIAPEKIENIYVQSKFVGQVFVYGNSYKSSLVGIVVPEEMVLFAFAKQNNLPLNMKELCKIDKIKEIILKDLTELGKSGGLKGFEQVRDIYLSPELFTIENGLLTPTMKSKRSDLQKYFQKEIDFMYKNAD